MSGRTVAEIIGQTSDGNWPHDGRRLPAEVIIGWECPACGEWINEAGPHTQCPKDWRNATPNVDVMLAWLGQQPYAVWLHPKGSSGRSLTAGEPIAVTVCRVAADGSMEAPLYDHPAPTLLAALEAAVRAVDSDATGTSE